MKPSRLIKHLRNLSFVTSVFLIIASLLMSAIPTRVASAHHPEISGVVVCQQDGTQLVTWTINNWSGTALAMTITAINRSIGVSVGTVVNTSVQGQETLPGNQSGNITLTVSGSWPNGATGTTSAKVKLDGKCTPPPPPPSPDYQLNLSHIMCVEGQVEIHFVLLNVPDGITPGTLTYTYGSIVPGNHTGNVWHYTDYKPSGAFNIQTASVVVDGVTVNLHNPGAYADTYQCSPPPPPSITICYNNETMTVPVADLGQYPGYTEGACPPPPPVTICYNNQTMVVEVADLGQYPGYTEGACPPPPPVTICYNNQTMVVEVADLGQYPGYTEGACPPPPPVTICYNNQTMVVEVADLGQYPGYTEGACPPPPAMITICYNNQTMTVPLTSLGLYPGFTVGECPPPPVTICYNNETMVVEVADLDQYPGYTEGECLPPPVPEAVLNCFGIESGVFRVTISNAGPSGEVGYSTDVDGTIISLGTLDNLESEDVELPGDATVLHLYPMLQTGWGTAVDVSLSKDGLRACEEDPVSLSPFCSYQTPGIPHGWTVTSLNTFDTQFTWVYGSDSSPVAIDLPAGASVTFYTVDHPGESMQIFVEGILLASGEPVYCEAFVNLDLTPICAEDASGFNGWRVTNSNGGEAGFEYSITASLVAGIGTVPASSFVEFSTPIVGAADTLLLYSGGILQDSASAAGNCIPPDDDDPPPPVVIQRIPIPVTGSEQPVLIPVTGVDLTGGGKPISGLFMNLGFGFLGLGLVLTGIGRKRNN